MLKTLPEYTEDDCYKTLCDFASKMGLEIVYRNPESFPGAALAYVDVYNNEDGQLNADNQAAKER